MTDITLVKGHHEWYPIIAATSLMKNASSLACSSLRKAFPHFTVELENCWSSSERDRRVCILDGRKGMCEALLWRNSGREGRPARLLLQSKGDVVCSLTRAAVIHYHKPGGLEQQKFIVSHFRKLEVLRSWVGRLAPSGAVPGLSPPIVWWFSGHLWFSLVVEASCDLCLYLQVTFFL